MSEEKQNCLSGFRKQIRSKVEAQHRADEISVFRRELALLQQEQVLVLTHEQQTDVARYHEKVLRYLAAVFDIDATTKEKQLTLGLAITASLGTLALAAGVFFFYSQYWGGLPTSTQVQILAGAPFLGLLCTTVTAMIRRSAPLARLPAVITWLCFVLNVFFLGRIYNCFPAVSFMAAYAAFAFILAYAVTSRLLLAAGIISASCFLAALAMMWRGWYWIGFYEHPEHFFTAALLFFLLSLIPHRSSSGFSSAYRICALLLFFLPVLVLSSWGEISDLKLPVEHIETIYQLVGFIGSGLFIAAGIFAGWNETVNTGYVFFTFFLFIKCYDWWWDWMPRYQFFLAIGAVAILIFMGLKLLRYLVLQQNHQRLSYK